MSPWEEHPNDPKLAPREFETTHWSQVLSAQDHGDARSGDALETLCRTYWRPLYVYVRRLGWNPTDAEDLTQAFFERVLERKYLERADRGRGRFRAFLLSSLRNFIADERDRLQAWKRGGRVSHVPVDTEFLERDAIAFRSEEVSPEEHYDRMWAATILERARTRMRAEAVESGREALFDALMPAEAAPGVESYEAVGARLGMSEGAVKVAAFRLRQRYRELVREEVLQTVASVEDLGEELRHMMRVLSSGA